MNLWSCIFTKACGGTKVGELAASRAEAARGQTNPCLHAEQSVRQDFVFGRTVVSRTSVAEPVVAWPERHSCQLVLDFICMLLQRVCLLRDLSSFVTEVRKRVGQAGGHPVAEQQGGINIIASIVQD